MSQQNLLPKPQVYVENSPFDARVESPNRIDEILTSSEIERYRHQLESPHFGTEGYVLRRVNGKEIIYAETKAGRFHAQNTARRLVRDDVLVVDHPEFGIRGVVEGFYGVPWSWQERNDIVETSSEYGFNCYVYAPCDINLKVNWRQPLTTRHKEKLSDLISNAHAHHMKFVYEILPIQIDLESEAEYRTLVERCQEVTALGVDAIMFAFDDMNDYTKEEVESRKAAQRQVDIANRLYRDIQRDHMFVCFVPVEYHGTENTPYLRVIGQELDPNILIGWTGPQIRSEGVTSTDAEAHGAIVGRKPFWGHNFPVIDEMDKKRRITVGPLIGAAPDLVDRLSGIAFNFMELPYASLVSGLTCADYAWNPRSYDPNQSIQNSCHQLGPNLMRLVELNPESYVNPSGMHPLARILREKRASDLSPSERAQLNAVFNAMVDLDSVVADGTDPRIYRELRPWLNQGDITGTLGNLILSGEIDRLDWKERGWASIKMNGGYRLSGVVFENWIYRELGFPSSLLQRNSFRQIADFFDRVRRKRHLEQ